MNTFSMVNGRRLWIILGAALLLAALGVGVMQVSALFKTDRFTVAELFDADGSAIIVHTSPDNYANIPTRYAPAPDQTTLNTGDAGGRLACGMIETN